jgi:arabinose-5-phosphate isomerase
LPATVAREACPFNMAPTTSTTATLALGDALAMVLLDARGFKREDYAKLHPSGSIGKALLLRVGDIMRHGDRVASVPEDASLKDVLLAMTEARSGSAGIVDASGKLLGIFTDGDLRRHMGDTDNILDQPITALMTKSPITVREDELAVDVLKIFEDHNIDDLLVVDETNHIVGAVDIQDLPKLKIM